MPEAAFLVLEMPGLHQMFTDYTARLPGTVIDIAMEPLHPGTPDLEFQAVALVQGAPLGTLDALLADARGQGTTLRTLERDDEEGRWLGTLRAPTASLTDPRALRIFQFLQENGIGLRWARVEDGVAYGRCQVPAGMSPEALAERCRGYVAALDLDAEVSVERVVERDLGVWLELATLAAKHARTA